MRGVETSAFGPGRKRRFLLEVSVVVVGVWGRRSCSPFHETPALATF
jgi:hypothetical protein